MNLSALDYLAAGGAAVAAGALNALAGGGTLVSFPTLTALGVPTVSANVTNTVALCPGYLSGTYAQRADLEKLRDELRWMSGLAAVGGLAGSILLVVTPEKDFRGLVPYLILLSCALLLSQDRLRAWLTRSHGGSGDGEVRTRQYQLAMGATVTLAAVYGGYFGAGLGIMLLGVLGLFSAEPLDKLNALKQALSFVINIIAAVSFAITGHVRWELVPVMAVAALIGGTIGGRLVNRVNGSVLRKVVVVAGVAIAISYWVG